MWLELPKIPEKYPWLDDNQKQRLENKVATFTGTEKEIKKQELYKNAITINIQQKYKTDREVLKNNLLYDATTEQDQTSKKQKETQYKITNLSDLIKQKYNIDVSKNDNDVLKSAIWVVPNWQKLLADYINNDDDSIMLLLWLDWQEKQWEPSTLSNIAEWAYRFAAWLPWMIGETGILDKPAELLARWVAKVTGKEFDETAPSFSETLKESATGGDRESTAAKVTENVLWAAELVWWLAATKTALKVASKLTKESKLLKPATSLAKWEIVKNSELNKVWKLIEQKTWPAYTAAKRKAGEVIEKWGKIISLPSKQELSMIDDVKNIVDTTKSIDYNMAKLGSTVDNEVENLVKIVSDNDAVVPKREVISRLKKLPKSPEIVWDVEKSYEKVIKLFEWFVKQNPWKASWLLRARKDFYQNTFVKKTLSNPDSPLYDVVRQIGWEVNNIIWEYAWSDLVKTSLRKQSNIIRVLENMSKKWEAIDSTKLKRFIKKNKWLISVWAGWLGVWGLVWWALSQ